MDELSRSVIYDHDHVYFILVTNYHRMAGQGHYILTPAGVHFLNIIIH